jgi:hypothetical protein
MNMVNSQEIIRDNKWEPEEMVYVNNRKKLVLLQEHNSIWNFILLEPMNNTAYVADYLYHPNAVYYSLDSDHNDLFVSTGEKNRLYFQRLGMALPSPIGCPKNERIEVISIKDIPTSISPSLQSKRPFSFRTIRLVVIVCGLHGENTVLSPCRPVLRSYLRWFMLSKRQRCP